MIFLTVKLLNVRVPGQWNNVSSQVMTTTTIVSGCDTPRISVDSNIISEWPARGKSSGGQQAAREARRSLGHIWGPQSAEKNNKKDHKNITAGCMVGACVCQWAEVRLPRHCWQLQGVEVWGQGHGGAVHCGYSTHTHSTTCLGPGGRRRRSLLPHRGERSLHSVTLRNSFWFQSWGWYRSFVNSN